MYGFIPFSFFPGLCIPSHTRLPTGKDSTLARERPTPRPGLSLAQSLDLRIALARSNSLRFLCGVQRERSLAGLRESKPEPEANTPFQNGGLGRRVSPFLSHSFSFLVFFIFRLLIVFLLRFHTPF